MQISNQVHPDMLIVTHLGTQLQVGSNNRHLNDRDNQHQAHNAEEAENIVIATFVLPQTPEHKQELDEDDRKGYQTRQEHRVDALRVPRLIGDLPWDAVGLRRMLPCLTAMTANPATGIHERYLNQKPQRNQSDQSSERYGSARCLRPHEEVEDEYGGKQKPRKQEGRL